MARKQRRSRRGEDYPELKIEATPVINGKQDVFVVCDGVRIARRGYPGTPQAGTWVSIEPGWEVHQGPDYKYIDIRYNGVTLQ